MSYVIERYPVPVTGVYQLVGNGEGITPLSFAVLDDVPFVFVSQSDRDEVDFRRVSDWDPDRRESGYYLKVILSTDDFDNGHDWGYVGSVDVEVDGNSNFFRAYWRYYD